MSGTEQPERVPTDPPSSLLSRRSALRLGTVTAGAALLSGYAGRALADTSPSPDWGHHPPGRDLPVREIEHIVGSAGFVVDDVLFLSLARKDLTVHGKGILFKPAWVVRHAFGFQSIGADQAMFNGELAVLATEIEPVIDAILRNNLTFQALHQHFFGLDPQIWHIHTRGTGDPRDLARRLHQVVAATSVPLPQLATPPNTTPLDTERLLRILGGHYTVAAEGVVHFQIPRRSRVWLGGTLVDPLLYVYAHCAFEPLDHDGRVAVAPDFSMTWEQVNPVMKVMRAQGWEVDCLYNQEIGENPQLFYSHQFKIGDAYQLAAEVRRGLDLTDVVNHPI